MFRLSPTKLSTYRECPRKYRFQYIDRLGPLYRKARPYFTMGSNVHAALKSFFSLPLRARRTQALTRLLEEQWERNRVGFRSPQEEQQYKGRALLQLQRYADATDLRVKPLMTETSLRSRVAGMLLEGVVDRVDQVNSGAHVLDYKTGAAQQSLDPLPLYMYALMLRSRRKMPPVEQVSFVFLESGLVKSWDFDPVQGMRSLQEVLEGAFTIAADRAYQPRPGWWCRGCDFLEICPAGQARAERALHP